MQKPRPEGRGQSTEVLVKRLVIGGDDGIRTHDPLLAKQVLCQLSYVPALQIVGGDPADTRA
jgi:hypothetical protein